MIEATRHAILVAIVLASFPAIGRGEPADTAAGVIHVASRARTAIRVDGVLAEPAWRDARLITGFRQVEPVAGAPTRFPTFVRVLFDSVHLYIGVECRDPLGARGVRVQDLRRKFDYFQNDLFGVSIDALHDGRNVAAFQITPYGAQRELQVFDDVVYNREWEAVWRVRTAIGDSGWTAEIAIPWSTLRYRSDTTPWNINFYRIARRANETSAWAPWPRNATAYRVDYAGRLSGVEAPPPRNNVRVRPYTLAGGNRIDRSRSGGELTWAPRSNAALDLTVNTDFAQAEVDRQVINTTRFSVFFPERRQFFLESGSLFDVGPTFFTLKPFFSRRIGLDGSGAPIPLDVGGRFVRRGARGNEGLLLMRQAASGDQPAATFGVARVSRNLGATSRVGALVATRADDAQLMATTPADRSVTSAIDGFTRVSPTLALSGMLSTQSASIGHGSGYAASAGMSRSTTTLNTTLDAAIVSRDYNPPTGFVQRRDVIVTRGSAGYDWRPSWKPRALRRFYPYAAVAVYHGASDRHLQDRFHTMWVDFSLDNGALVYPQIGYDVQYVTSTFRPVRGVTIAPGRYPAWRPTLYAGSDPSARFGGSMILASGGYFDRKRDEAALSLRASPSPRVALVTSYNVNRFRDAPNGEPSVLTHLLSPELRLALNPRLQLTTFYQYNSDAARGALNARLSWEFAPLSYVYVVTNDLRAAGPDGATVGPPRPARQLVVKLVWMRQL